MQVRGVTKEEIFPITNENSLKQYLCTQPIFKEFQLNCIINFIKCGAKIRIDGLKLWK